MKAARDPLLAALDGDGPVQFFVRDDDAGWADDRLLALLDTMAGLETPIDLAAIPAACGPALCAELRSRLGGQALGVHQHGWTHANHQAEGRKGEFGTDRTATQRHHDIAQGRERLLEAFGETLDPIFTPPWNRCTDDTPALLRGLGLSVLSRDASAPPQSELTELPVHVDWCRQWRLADGRRDEAAWRVSAELARHARAGATVGLMLHHAVMSGDELDLLRTLLQRWTSHPQARWVSMRAARSEAVSS